MAKIKFGMMMTDARGKLGGQVFSKNRAGAYVRTKVTPVNPRTSFQQAGRAILGVLSANWNELADLQRASFNEAVADWQKTDIFGDLKKPTGKNLYVALNKNLAQAGLPQITTAPEKVEMPLIESLEIIADLTAETITISGLPAIATGRYQVWATPPLNAGVSFVKNRLRVFSYQANPSANPDRLFEGYVARFGNLALGDNVHFQIRYIGANGQASVPIIAKGVIE